MHSGIPKQFLEVAGKPILLHTLERVLSVEHVIQVVIALPPEHIPTAQAILQQAQLRADIQCTSGGPNRQESVRNGTAHARQDADIIMVHDAVRPVCPRDMMLRVLDAAWKKGAAVPGIPATETIQRVSRSGRVLSTPPRRELFAIQTPQAFHAGILKSALERAHSEGFLGTDESSVVRWAGHPVFVVPGSPDNIKITRPLDLEIAERLMAGGPAAGEPAAGQSAGKNAVDRSESGFRVGHGIDYHRLVEGRKLILGGVEIPFEKGLEGHSDADALAHAVCDALLGAAGMGDIGRHFPDTDTAHRGRPSLEFLQEVRAKLAAEGWSIRNVDATLLLQRPRVAPHALAMRQNIAASLGLSVSEVNVKATTTEGMNAEGRGEGISAHSVALIYKKYGLNAGLNNR